MKNIIITILIIFLIVSGYFLFAKNQKHNFQTNNISTSTQAEEVKYVNNEYGFSFLLPQDWKGYSIVNKVWEGDIIGGTGDVPVEQGPLILIRNPKWTEKNPYQDIPIMVFTIDQWNSLQQDKFHIGAAPINPSELGRNSKYVFALPARYNYAFPSGWEEVKNILEGHPLQIQK